MSFWWRKYYIDKMTRSNLIWMTILLSFHFLSNFYYWNLFYLRCFSKFWCWFFAFAKGGKIASPKQISAGELFFLKILLSIINMNLKTFIQQDSFHFKKWSIVTALFKVKHKKNIKNFNNFVYYFISYWTRLVQQSF